MIIGGLDTETTGLLKPEHRLIELHIGKWELDGPMPTKQAEKTWRIHPDRSIDPKAQAVHNITLDDLAGCPKLEQVIDEIIAFMQGVDLWVAHNGEGFDKPFMRMEIERVARQHLPWFDRQKWFDTMLDGRWAHPWGKVPNLGELAWASDVEYDTTKAHAADYDVNVMMKAFFFGTQRGFFNAIKLA
jgi:DNA polymerase-3 subunit epsilon